MNFGFKKLNKLIIASTLAAFSALGCAQTSKQYDTYPSKGVQSIITFFADGRVEVRDGEGNLIEGIPEDKFFSCSDAHCDGVDVRKILRITPTVIGIQVSGSHYEIKKIGDNIYKIPLPH